MLQTNIYISTHLAVIISILTNNHINQRLNKKVLTIVSKKFKMTTYIIDKMVYIIDKDINKKKFNNDIKILMYRKSKILKAFIFSIFGSVAVLVLSNNCNK